MRTDRSLEAPANATFEGGTLPGRHFDDGVSLSGRERNHLFLSFAAEQFGDVSGVSGLDDPADARAFALLDFDRDGRLDLATVNANAPLFELFHNEIAGAGNALVVRVEGANRSAAPRAGASPRDAVGARVEVEAGGARLVREVRAGEGLAAQNLGRLVIGLGAAERADAVTVTWPSGRSLTERDVPAGTLVSFVEPGADDAGRVARSPYVATPAPPHAGPADRPTLLAGVAPADGLRVFTTQATWCQACVDDLPQVALLREAFPEVAFFGVPVEPRDTPEKLRRWAARHDPAYRLLTDLGEPQRDAVRGHVSRTLGREGVPATIVTDAEGHVLRTQWGVPTLSQLRAIAPGPS